MLLGIVMAESDAPEDDVEEKEHHEVDHPAQVVYLVSLHPVRVPAWVLPKGIDLVGSLRRRLVIINTPSSSSSSSSALSQPQLWVYGFGLGTENT